jgi:hypothetical protein
MNVVVSAKPENEYLFIKVSGAVTNQEEHRLLTRRFYLEIKEHGSNHTIIDVSEASFPNSLEFLHDIIAFYSEELPDKVKHWKIAVVDESSYRELGKYWEFLANQQGFMGYKVFSSMKEAQASIQDIGPKKWTRN